SVSVADMQGNLRLAQVPKNITLNVGDRIPVMLGNSGAGPRSQNEFLFVRATNFAIQPYRSKNIGLSPSFEKILKGEVSEGFIIRVNCQVVAIKQTSGPTLFKITDEPGNTITGVGFTEAGARAFPAVMENTVLEAVGHYNIHQGQTQIDLREMTILGNEESEQFRKKALQRLLEKTKAAEIPFSVKSETLEKLRPNFSAAAEKIRRAVLTGRTIYLKYHANCVDGACAEVLLDQAILDLGRSKSSEARINLRKHSLRGNSYEFADASRDVVSLLEEQTRGSTASGEPPLFVLIDIGSSDENLLTLNLLGMYDIETVVLDNHSMSQSLRSKISVTISPYLISEGYLHNLSVAMLAFELGRLVSANHDAYSNRMKHLPVVSGIAEQVMENPDSEMAQYRSFLSDSVFKDKVTEMADAIDYQSTFLRPYSDGGMLVSELLGLGASPRLVDQYVPMLANEARTARENAIKATSMNFDQSTINPGSEETLITKIDFELAPRINYPSPSKSAELLHEQLAKTNPTKRIMTIGIGFDYVIIHCSRIINFRPGELVASLKQRIPNASVVDGAGHGARIGVIRFFAPYKREVLEFILTEASFLK
ncbi:MAG TPA: hypothetical protein VJ044_12610, partial [Candidatus Hodarchaeales archaeon]|nr:hypothetical protein [Candidatus Hodarchaeales archaeon]